MYNMAILIARFVAFLLLYITMPFLVSAYSTGAGTCNVDEISQGHGSAMKSGVGGYFLSIRGSGASFEITINGNDAANGVLLYIQGADGTKTGTFTIPTNFQSKDCGSGLTTITHKDSNSKTLPLKFNWKPSKANNGNFTIRADVVKSSQSDWYKLQDLAFNPSGDVDLSNANSVDSTTSTDTSVPTDTWINKYGLFVAMIVIITTLYITGSITEVLLKRQQNNARSLGKTVNGG